MSIVSPIGFCRTAVKAQLAHATLGLNPNLVTYAAAYGVPAWSFDFSSTSRNFLEANVDYTKTEETDIPQKNLLTLYGDPALPFPEHDRVFGTAFSGTVALCCDMYIGSLAEKIGKFEAYVDAASAAMLQTMNTVTNQNVLNAPDAATRSGKVYKMDLGIRPAKSQFDGENWIIPIRFTMSFGVVIP